MIRFARWGRVAALAWAGLSGAGMAMAAPDATAQGGDRAAMAAQLQVELELAPAEIRRDFAADRARFHEFVVGRLHDEKIAAHARSRQLDQRAAVRAVIGSFERDTLVRAAVNELLEREAERLPDLEPLARERYLADREAYRVPESARIAHILIRADVETMSDEEIAERRRHAESLLGRIRAGEEFAGLARSHSEDTKSARDGGVLPGTVGREGLVPKFAEAALALQPGGTSELVRTRYGFHIIRLIELTPSTIKPFDEVKSSIIAKLRDDLLAPKRAQFIDGFRDAALGAEADALLPLLAPVLEQSVNAKAASAAAK